MTVLVTGAAGFVGYHTARALLARGERVLGVDNLNDYYDPALKRARLELLQEQPGFAFKRLELSDRDAVSALIEANPEIRGILHLAAQAGVRHSLVDPYAYVDANVMAQLVMLEAALRLPALRHFVYASSSSVYGGNRKIPFSVDDRVDTPVSVYAATKRAGELLAETYAHLHGLAATGLRFFTVYGPWGRPDMAYYIFTQAIMAGEPIRVFNEGNMRRDFTYIDDVVDGVLAALERPPSAGEAKAAPHRIYNLGNHQPVALTQFIETLERLCGRQAIKRLDSMQPGDVQETYADITSAARDLGFSPHTSIEDGLARFVTWFREYHGA